MQILLDHVVVGAFTAADLADGTTLTTAGGTELTVAIDNGVVILGAPNGGTMAIVTMTDLVACESIVHTIDNVLVAGDSTAAMEMGAGVDVIDAPASGAAGVAVGVAALAAAAAAALL